MAKLLRGNCQHCGGTVEFSAEHTGESAPCPHCHALTDLLLPPPPEERSPLRTRAMVFFGIVLVILIAGLVGMQLAIKRAKRLTGQNPEQTVRSQPASPFAVAGFHVSLVTLEKATNSSLVYAVGIVTERAQRRRFSVRVELALYDREGRVCGSAQDYTAALPAGESWRFRAMVINPQAVRAEISRITEDR